MPPGAHEKTAAERDEEFRERQSMVTADEMIFGQRANGVAEGSTGEKKKGSKQRHAERQVSFHFLGARLMEDGRAGVGC